MPTINHSIKKKEQNKKTKSPALMSNPFLRGICEVVTTLTPKKPKICFQIVQIVFVMLLFLMSFLLDYRHFPVILNVI